MNIFSICVIAVTAAVMYVMLKQKNGETAIMLVIASSVMMLLMILSQASSVFTTISQISEVSGISSDYVEILLKVIGICLLTEFAVNTCKDAGSASLAGNVSLAGKIMVTAVSLPLYGDILNTVLGLLS